MSVQIGSAKKVEVIVENPSNPSEAAIKELVAAITLLFPLLPSQEVHVGTTPPENPDEGDMWYNIAEDPARLYLFSP